jgi:hypothetical protein
MPALCVEPLGQAFEQFSGFAGSIRGGEASREKLFSLPKSRFTKVPAPSPGGP